MAAAAAEAEVVAAAAAAGTVSTLRSLSLDITYLLVLLSGMLTCRI